MRRALFSALALFAACSRHEMHEDARPPDGEAWLSQEQLRNGHIEVAPVEERLVAEEITAPGRIAFDDSKVARVFSPVSGRVSRIHAQIGARVRKGAPLVTLDAPDAGGATADAGKAEVDLTAADRELARARERVRLLRGRGAAGRGQEFTLRSPIDGEVIARNVTPGMEVAGQAAGGTSAELFTVGDIDRVWAVADLFEMDLAKIKPGAVVAVRVVAWPDRVFPGRIDWISKVLDPASRSVRIRAVLENGEHELLPEMTASVAIAMPAPLALALPRTALLRLGEQTFFFNETATTENGLFRFEERRVRVESDDADPVVVLSGLGRGEQVVVSGSLLVSGML